MKIKNKRERRIILEWCNSIPDDTSFIIKLFEKKILLGISILNNFFHFLEKIRWL